MKYTIPDYYPEFHCIAGACPATCCAGWQIVIDRKSLHKYSRCKSHLGNRLRNSIDWKNGVFLQYDQKCSFLDENHLCDLYSEGGEDMLCRTCRRYPRHIEEFENEREISLSISCPVVARMILGRKEKVTFLSRQDMSEEKEDEQFDFLLYSVLQDSRALMIDLLQDRERSIGFRMAKVLALAHDIQNRINTRRLFETESLLERYRRASADQKLELLFRRYSDSLEAKKNQREVLDFMDDLEVLDSGWREQLCTWKTALDREYVEYVKLFEAKKKNTGSKSEGGRICQGETERETECEQLMVYFLYTYFCGAVYDGDVLSKVKMAVVSTMMIQKLEKALSLLTGKPLLLEDRARIAWSYSRELEHSDLNLNRMEHMMKEKKEASFEKLMTICCSLPIY